MVPCREPLCERVGRQFLKSASTPGLLFRRECFSVDKGFICAIIYIGKGAADRRFAPPMLLRSNRQVGSLGRLLLFCQQNDFDNQTDETDDECTKQKQFRICNHVVTPFPQRTGGKEAHPLLMGEQTAYRGASRSESEFSDCQRQSHQYLLWQRPGSEEPTVFQQITNHPSTIYNCIAR